MMFIPIEFDSINRIEMAPAGVYTATCETYAAAQAHMHTQSTLLLFAYAHEGGSAPCFHDMVLVDPHGVVQVRDYAWMPDRTWRDSAGAKSVDLAALLPAELLQLRFVKREALPSITIGNHHV